MATTCFGQRQPESSELANFVPDEVPVLGAAAAPDEVLAPGAAATLEEATAADEATASGEATAADDDPAPEEAMTADEDTAFEEAMAPAESAEQPAALSDPTLLADEPRLALAQMAASMQDGLLMVFGPEGDPVPPQAFTDAAAMAPEALVTLPDGAAVPASRVAIVLRAQTLGRLGAAEDGGWIMAMLRDSDWPDVASEQDLAAEQDDFVLTGEETPPDQPSRPGLEHLRPSPSSELDRAASVTMTDDVMLDLRSPAEPLPPEATAGMAVVSPEPVGSPGPAEGIDAENIVLVVIWGVPDSVRLSAGVRDDDGCWSLSPLDLPDLTIAPAFGEGPGEIGDRELTITGIAMTDDGTLTGFTETVPLADYLTADRALEATYAADHRQAGSDRAAIALDVGPALWHGQAFDALVIRDLPAGARLSAGAYDPTIDGWVLRPQELGALAIIPPADQRTDFTLTLFGVALRAGHANGARVLARLPVSLT